jgi:hypothetical protein
MQSSDLVAVGTLGGIEKFHFAAIELDDVSRHVSHLVSEFGRNRIRVAKY